MQGYTLIELVILIALVGLMVFVVVPNISGMLQTPAEDAGVKWLTIQVQVLKKAAETDGVVYALHADTSENSFWITAQGMDERLVAAARDNRYRLPWGARIHALVFPEGLFSKDVEMMSMIRFYPKGYSDPAMIQLASGDTVRTVEIRPLLQTVRVHEGAVDYDG
ncbi:MAG: hypothetical protein CSA22_04630 [Deltaproteobacteria bacterium]|nr:MAG: hypothetical protein CSA22_04630 [Deltaproteobacteria bacterium]